MKKNDASPLNQASLNHNGVAPPDQNITAPWKQDLLNQNAVTCQVQNIHF
jgi:hypothetical protein